MTIDDFKEKLQSILSDEQRNAKLYATTKGTKDAETKRISISTEISDGLLKLFSDRISELFLDDDIVYRLKPIEENDDESARTYYYFHGNNTYEKLNILKNLKSLDRSFLNFNQTTFADIETFYITISNGENTLTLYKKNYPINVLKRGKTLFFMKDKENIDELKQDVLKIDRSFQFLALDNYIIIVNLSMLENQLGYKDIITQNARDFINVIAALNFLEDVAKLEEMAETARIAKKVNLAKDSPVLKIITSDLDRIKNFIESIDELRKSLKFNADNKLQLNSQVGVEKFLKLLNDAYLRSELTDIRYDSSVKEKI